MENHILLPLIHLIFFGQKDMLLLFTWQHRLIWALWNFAVSDTDTGSATMEIMWKKMIWFKSKRLMQVVKPRRDESKNYWNKYLRWNLQERFTAVAGVQLSVSWVNLQGSRCLKNKWCWGKDLVSLGWVCLWSWAPQVPWEHSWFSAAVTLASVLKGYYTNLAPQLVAQVQLGLNGCAVLHLLEQLWPHHWHFLWATFSPCWLSPPFLVGFSALLPRGQEVSAALPCR